MTGWATHGHGLRTNLTAAKTEACPLLKRDPCSKYRKEHGPPNCLPFCKATIKQPKKKRTTKEEPSEDFLARCPCGRFATEYKRNSSPKQKDQRQRNKKPTAHVLTVTPNELAQARR
jgi:hypothetical protein